MKFVIIIIQKCEIVLYECIIGNKQCDNYNMMTFIYTYNNLNNNKILDYHMSFIYKLDAIKNSVGL